jgi:hypothetical protein
MSSNWIPETTNHPLPTIWVTRFLIGIIILLAFVAGYYEVTSTLERKRYLRLEDMYVRVRGELGINETQRLIDQSRQESP